jgi:tetratricopeptide (TPR) repeat protein
MSEYALDKPSADKLLKTINLTQSTLSADTGLIINAAMAYSGVMIQNKDYIAAHSLINRLLSANIKPYNTRILNLNGVAYLRDKNLVKAKENFEKAISEDQNYAVSYYNLGLVYEKMGNFEQAAASYRKALAYNPRFVPAIRKLKEMSQRAKKPEPDSDLIQ